MSTALQNSLNGLLTPDFVSQTADSLGEKGSAVAKAMSAIFPAMIGSLGDHADDPSFMSSVYDQVAAPDNDPSILSNPARLIGKAAMALPSMMLGSKFLKMMFGPKVKDLSHDVSGYAGVRDSSAQSMLGIAAPLVLGALGKLVRAGNMNVASLARLLRGEGQEAHMALPNALSHLDRYSSIPPAPSHERHRAMQSRVHHVPAEQRKSSMWRWLLPLMLAVAGVWLLSTLFGRPGEPADVMTAPATVDLEEIEVTAPPPRPEPEPLKAAPVLELEEPEAVEEPEVEVEPEPMKAELEPEPMEADVDVVIEADPKPMKTTDTKVIELEEQVIRGERPTTATIDPAKPEPGVPSTMPTANVFFAADSVRLPADVEVSLLSVVTYMKANPSSTAMLSTYHSTEGDLAGSKKMASDRADAVRDELVSSGIAQSRIRIMDPLQVTGAQPNEERVQVRVRR